MSNNVQTQQPAASNDTVKTPAAALTIAPTIAIRKSCNPEGIGLSHYVLMDRKAAK